MKIFHLCLCGRWNYFQRTLISDQGFELKLLIEISNSEIVFSTYKKKKLKKNHLVPITGLHCNGGSTYPGYL